jgi:hypothetical protein
MSANLADEEESVHCVEDYGALYHLPVNQLEGYGMLLVMWWLLAIVQLKLHCVSEPILPIHSPMSVFSRSRCVRRDGLLIYHVNTVVALTAWRLAMGEVHRPKPQNLVLALHKVVATRRAERGFLNRAILLSSTKNINEKHKYFRA